MLLENSYHVVIRSLFEDANNDELRKQFASELKLSDIQSDFIVENLPVVLYHNLAEDEIEAVKPRLDSLMQAGVNYEITKNNVENATPMLWKSEMIIKALAKKNIAETESETMNETPEEIIINCPCASCGTVLKITKTKDGIEIKSISAATKNPLKFKTDELHEKKYSVEELENIVKAVENNVYGGIENIKDLPTKPEFTINFEDYGFKSFTDFMEYQDTLIANKSLDSWTGGN